MRFPTWRSKSIFILIMGWRCFGSISGNAVTHFVSYSVNLSETTMRAMRPAAVEDRLSGDAASGNGTWLIKCRCSIDGTARTVCIRNFARVGVGARARWHRTTCFASPTISNCSQTCPQIRDNTTNILDIVSSTLEYIYIYTICVYIYTICLKFSAIRSYLVKIK